MIVVADSGPLHYLILLDHAELLRRFYGHVMVHRCLADGCQRNLADSEACPSWNLSAGS